MYTTAMLESAIILLKKDMRLFFFDGAKPQNIAGLFLETHPDPSIAKCDGPCALKLSDLDIFMEKIISLDEFVKNSK